MCLPHCPTYSVYRNEAESPRGRIVLMQSLARNNFQADEALYKHLDHCVGCLACEAMCPSRVPFGKLINKARELALKSHKPPARVNRLLNTVIKPDGLNRYQGWLGNKAIQSISGVGLKLFGEAKTRLLLNQAGHQRLANYYPASSTTRGDVALFTGCMGKLFDMESLQASVRLLNHYGFNVHIPARQSCCGALHENNGFPDEASRLIRDSQQMFASMAIDYIIYTANGCGAQLSQHAFPVPLMDTASFLLEHTAINPDDFTALDAPVVLHQSCSTTNKLKIAGTSQRLLEMIPDIQLLTLQNANICCGAGGSHLISQADTADRIISPKIDEILQLKPRYIISDNTGCSMHFRSNLAQAGLDTDVIHPASLLARQLK